jgi:small-conductance mechanosensitive channel
MIYTKSLLHRITLLVLLLIAAFLIVIGIDKQNPAPLLSGIGFLTIALHIYAQGKSPKS